MHIDCPNHKEISDKLSECSVLIELGIKYIVSPNRSGSPCRKCVKEWQEPPTKETLTPIMKMIVKANGRIELPTITERAISFTKAVIKQAFNGFQNVPEIYQKERINICEKNTCGMFDEKTRQCLACGCFIDIKSKWSGEACPAGFWGPENLPKEVVNNAPQGCQSCGHR